MRPSPATPEALREAGPSRPGGSAPGSGRGQACRAAGLAGARCVCLGQTQGRLTPSPLRGRKIRPVRANRRLFHARAPATEAAGTGRSASVSCVALLLSLLARPRCPVPAALTHEPGNGERPACPRRRAFFLVPIENMKATTTDFNPFGEKFFLPPTPPPLQAKEGDSEASARKIALSLQATACTHLEYGCVLKVASMRFEGFVIRWF